MSTEGSVPIGDDRWNILKRANIPFSELQRLEPTWLLRLENPDSCQNTTPLTSTPRINATVAP
eukprot:5388279-Pyramimonas_sp.AAC.1